MTQRKQVATQPAPLRLEVSRSLFSKGKKLPARISELVREMLKEANIHSGNYSFHVFSSSRRYQDQFGDSISIANNGEEFNLTVSTGSFEYSGAFSVKGSRVEGLQGKLIKAALTISRKYALPSTLPASQHEGLPTRTASSIIAKYTPGNGIVRQEKTQEVAQPSKWFNTVCELEDLERKFLQCKASYEANMNRQEPHLLEDIPLIMIAESLRMIRSYKEIYSETLTRTEKFELIKRSLKTVL